VRPVHYSLPSDGPVGLMLRSTNRHSWRPAHIHFLISADGYESVTTHIFDSVDEYLESDTVFGVKDSLIGTFEERDVADQQSRRLGINPPFCTVRVEFVLKPLR
jgi:hydroxyquinol 1,2-dioxygenase